MLVRIATTGVRMTMRRFWFTSDAVCLLTCVRYARVCSAAVPNAPANNSWDIIFVFQVPAVVEHAKSVCWPSNTTRMRCPGAFCFVFVVFSSLRHCFIAMRACADCASVLMTNIWLYCWLLVAFYNHALAFIFFFLGNAQHACLQSQQGALGNARVWMHSEDVVNTEQLSLKVKYARKVISSCGQ